MIGIGISLTRIAVAAAGAGGVAPPTPAYDPVALFSGGGVGMLYDSQTISTLWQDVAGTIPVTADGQLVARIDDRSGNGRHLTQATAANRLKYRDDGKLRWLDSEGRACIYTTAHQLTGPLTYGFAAEVTQSTAGGNLFDTGATSGTDANAVYVSWSTSSAAIRLAERGGGTLSQRDIAGGANRHMALVVRLPETGNSNFTDYGRSPVSDLTARLGAGTTTGAFRLGSTIAKTTRFYGMFVAQRLISDAEREAVASYYATLGRLDNLFMWMGDAQ